MRTDTPQPIRLSDYRVPDFLVATVALDISLDLAATRVRARLAMRRNPAGRADVPLVLDGDELVPVSVRLDGVDLDLASGFAGPQKLTIDAPLRHDFILEIETLLNPAANTKLMGLYRSGAVLPSLAAASQDAYYTAWKTSADGKALRNFARRTFGAAYVTKVLEIAAATE